jgi:hypothetical protein
MWLDGNVGVVTPGLAAGGSLKWRDDKTNGFEPPLQPVLPSFSKAVVGKEPAKA